MWVLPLFWTTGVIFSPPFLISDDFSERWTQSKAKSDYGKFTISAGAFYGDAELDKGGKICETRMIFLSTSVPRYIWHPLYLGCVAITL